MLLPIGRENAVVARHAWVSYAILALNIVVFVLFQPVPAERFGYVPGSGALRIVTYAFLHAGFMHLLGNLLFFFVTGPFVEDVFGRPLFAALYFSGGGVAALSFASAHPGTDIPLIGSSGAVAAIMGAYLVRFATTRLEFVWIGFPRPHRFFIRAYVVLPLWLLQNLVMLRVEKQVGVAFSAHVGGFIYGALIAGLVYGIGYEERFVRGVVEKQTTWKIEPSVVHAMEAHAAGDAETARVQIDTALKRGAGNEDTFRLALNIAREAQDHRAADQHATRLFALYLQSGKTPQARSLIDELANLRGTPAPLPRFYSRAAAYTEQEGDREWTEALLKAQCECDPTSPPTFSALLKLASLRKFRGDFRGAQRALARAGEHPSCTGEMRGVVEQRMREVETANLRHG